MKILFTASKESAKVMEGEVSKLTSVIMFEELKGNVVFVENCGSYVKVETDALEEVEIITNDVKNSKEIFDSIKFKVKMTFAECSVGDL
ncbi:MAG: hypothetical protein ACRCZ9_09440 [Fusobacteriaceae bacterium]